MLDVGYGHGVVLHMDRRPQFFRNGTAHELSTAIVHRTLVVRLTYNGKRFGRSVGQLLRGVAVVDRPDRVLVSRDDTWSMRSLAWVSRSDAQRSTRWRRLDDVTFEPVELTRAATLEVSR